jgi:hypothetical protein
MRAVSKILAGGVVAATLFAAAPAAAQYYPGNPYGGGYGYGGNVVGQVINQVLGGGYGGYGGYGGGANSQVVVSQCVNAVQARLARNYNYGGYGGAYGNPGYGGYGPSNYAYGQARVLGVSRVEPRSRGGLTVRGVATSGINTGYAGYGGQQPVDLTFKCNTDYRGYVTDVDIDRAQSNYGSNYGYQPYGGYQSQDPYAAYGYRRY